MDVSYTHEMYVFNMFHFLHTVCTNKQDMTFCFSKNFTVLIFCNEQNFFLTYFSSI